MFELRKIDKTNYVEVLNMATTAILDNTWIIEGVLDDILFNYTKNSDHPNKNWLLEIYRGERNFYRYIDPTISTIYIDNILVGFVGLDRYHTPKESGCMVGWLYVDPLYRGKGYAKRAVMAALANSDCDVIEVEVDKEANNRDYLNKFYTGLGFVLDPSINAQRSETFRSCISGMDKDYFMKHIEFYKYTKGDK